MMHTTRHDSLIPLGPIALGIGLLITCLAATPALAQEWRIDWHTIDGGGTMRSESNDSEWQLSGTIGQADATTSEELSGSDWSLTGGFWAISPSEPGEDRLFFDRFEEPARSSP
ncbi:MAG: hypothetical protein V2J10_03820 [Wenzhouxiangella sp.]|jgi:hypothetical protein|nr:hypothetical protein [Wenzhouxiangella sp.]